MSYIVGSSVRVYPANMWVLFVDHNLICLILQEGQISIDPQEEVFRTIIARRNRAQVRQTFKEFQKVSQLGKQLEEC